SAGDAHPVPAAASRQGALRPARHDADAVRHRRDPRAPAIEAARRDRAPRAPMTPATGSAAKVVSVPADRWYERSIRRTRALAPGEERELTATLDAHRTAVVRDVLASSYGLSYLRELAVSLDARRIDVRGIVELEADARVEDARTACLARLGRVKHLGACRARRPRSAEVAAAVVDELRGLALRRMHVDAIVARMTAAGRSQARTLARLQRASDEAARARTRLVESHLRLVTAIARRYLQRGLDLP